MYASRFIDMAASVAAREHEFDRHRFRFGAVLAKKKRIISFGRNHDRTHPKSPSPWKTVHAELDVILRSRENVDGANLYVVRILACGSLAVSRPCNNCFEYVRQRGIGCIYYINSTGSLAWEKIQ